MNLDTGEWWIESSIGGNLTGNAKDGHGNPVSEANTSIGMKTTTTNLTSRYILKNLPPGNYGVTVSKSGYTPQLKTIKVKENQNTIANSVLVRDSESTKHKQYSSKTRSRSNQQVTVYSNVTDAKAGCTCSPIISTDDGTSWQNFFGTLVHANIR